MLPLFVCKNESAGAEVWKEDLIFTFELSSVCSEAHAVQREDVLSPSTQLIMKRRLIGLSK